MWSMTSLSTKGEHLTRHWSFPAKKISKIEVKFSRHMTTFQCSELHLLTQLRSWVIPGQAPPCSTKASTVLLHEITIIKLTEIIIVPAPWRPASLGFTEHL